MPSEVSLAARPKAQTNYDRTKGISLVFMVLSQCCLLRILVSREDLPTQTHTYTHTHHNTHTPCTHISYSYKQHHTTHTTYTYIIFKQTLPRTSHSHTNTHHTPSHLLLPLHTNKHTNHNNHKQTFTL